jgi:acyl carrier protein
MTDVGDVIRRLLRPLLQLADSDTVADDLALIEERRLDSLAIVMLATELEVRFDIEIAEDDLVLENVATPAALIRMVETKIRADA